MDRARVDERTGHAYVRATRALSRIGAHAGAHAIIPTVSRRGRSRIGTATRRRVDERTEIEHALGLSGLPLDVDTVLVASKTASALAVIGLAGALGLTWLVSGSRSLLVLGLLLAVVPIIAGEALRRYPGALCRKRAMDIARDSTGSISLMIMSLRREPSLSKAMSFASARGNSFSRELRACSWGVVMSRFSSFEEALQNLGERWAAFAGELKTALNALITASCEGTEDGRRRALDRANRVTVAGVKRRIEDYTLSLSTPSMVMFGLGILLPLMVGSFLPMLSWDVWSGPEPSLTGDPPDGSGHAIELVFVMNVLFPALGALVAVGSITRHPLARGPRAAEVVQNGHSSPLLLAIGVSIVLVATAVWQLEGIQRVAVALTCSVAPISVALIHLGQGDYLSGSRAETRLEEVLFRTGARMVEGENFESAACSARKGLVTRQRQNSGPFLCRSSSSGAMSSHPSNGPVLDSDALDAFEVVKEASSKDERAAGLLAMDLATYLRDIRETELTLKGRLRPTISMMRITSYALAPVVLAVTFAIYMTLGGMTGSGVGALDCELFFIVLGVFLAESNFVVQYFVWGIEGRKGRGLLMRSIGTCVLTSEIIFVVTALLAS